MPRFFLDAPLTPGTRVPLPTALSHHALRTLRLVDGDALTLFNGQGGEYSAQLVAPKGETASAEVLAFSAREAELPFRIIVAQGLSGGDKMDWTIEKAVELGAAGIVPLACARSVVRLSAERAAKRVEHWRALVTAACAQCGRNRVPVIEAPRPLTHWLADVPKDALRLVLTPRAEHSLVTHARATHPAGAEGASIYLLVGPEGGLAPEEEQAALVAGFTAVHMGPRVLRTETAAAAALAMLAAVWDDGSA